MADRLRSYWQNKTVLITGASSGLGWAITAALAEYGVHFGLLSRRKEKLQELAEKLSDSGSRFWYKACDVQDREQVATAIREFRETAGRLDVAWVNSGIGGDSSFENWNWDNFEAMIDTNLKGAIYTARTCLEIMVEQKAGALVGIGSASAMRGLPGRSVYGLTKIALEYYLVGQAAELPEVQFTIIHPGFVDTPINSGNHNRFWLQTPKRAAQIMIKAVADGKHMLIFPRRMAALFRLVRMLPLPAYLWLARKLARLSKSAPLSNK
ncbi:SDR family NAD(P)-dependent oxidoreductase [candidate division KSB1 bacterium]|nr:SDR family NAD(P)-dependent oxidoreductase [candidate division KSB1 bacterium]